MRMLLRKRRTRADPAGARDGSGTTMAVAMGPLGPGALGAGALSSKKLAPVDALTDASTFDNPSRPGRPAKAGEWRASHDVTP